MLRRRLRPHEFVSHASHSTHTVEHEGHRAGHVKSPAARSRAQSPRFAITNPKVKNTSPQPKSRALGLQVEKLKEQFAVAEAKVEAERYCEISMRNQTMQAAADEYHTRMAEIKASYEAQYCGD